MIALGIDPGFASLGLAAVERWRAVSGFEGRYDVSDRGNVRSWLYGGRRRNARRTEPRLLALSANSDGYPVVTLCMRCVMKTVPVHTLVAKAFLGPRPSGMEIHHRDGVKAHNMVENLAYVTDAEHQEHETRLGQHPRGERNAMVKATAESLRAALGAYAASGISLRVAAQRAGVSRTAIRLAIAGETWTSDIPAELRERCIAAAQRNGGTVGAMSRRKGKRGELELVGLANECGFQDARRGAPMQAAGGPHALPDVDGIPGLWAEAKRHGRTPIARLARELLAVDRPGFTVVLFSRDDGRGERWLATLDARELLNRQRELLDLRLEVARLRQLIPAASAT